MNNPACITYKYIILYDLLALPILLICLNFTTLYIGSENCYNRSFPRLTKSQIRFINVVMCVMKKRIHISSLLLDNVYDYWLPSHFWLVVSRECTNIVIITLYYFCMYAQFFFQSAFVDFDYGLQPLHYLHDFLHECIYSNIYEWYDTFFGGALYCDPILLYCK